MGLLFLCDLVFGVLVEALLDEGALNLVWLASCRLIRLSPSCCGLVVVGTVSAGTVETTGAGAKCGIWSSAAIGSPATLGVGWVRCLVEAAGSFVSLVGDCSSRNAKQKTVIILSGNTSRP